MAAVKEASGSLGQIMEILRDRPQGFGVLSGDDAFTLALMAHGGEGVISVVSNQVPREMHELAAAGLRGDFTEARRIHHRLLELMNLNFIESSPIPVKASAGPAGLVRRDLPAAALPAPGNHARGAARGPAWAGAALVGGCPSHVMAMTPEQLRSRVEGLAALPTEALGEEARAVFVEFRAALERGEVRAAEPGPDGWVANAWVKTGILLGFRLGRVVEMEAAGPLRFFDKDTLPAQPLTVASGVRVVPGGSAVRSGAYIAPGVVIMPPAYVNVGAWVGEGTLVDSHALVGSCAQIGRRVHLSAGAQIGGVLEPVGALPVIVEDEVLVGGNCGVYEGTIVGRRAVLAAGVDPHGLDAVFDLAAEDDLSPPRGGPVAHSRGSGGRARAPVVSTTHSRSGWVSSSPPPSS